MTADQKVDGRRRRRAAGTSRKTWIQAGSAIAHGPILTASYSRRMSDFPPVVPQLLHTVLDAVDVRREAEFWRDLLGLAYRAGDEVPEDGADDSDWLVLTHPDGRRCLAIQEVESLPGSRWPEPGHPSVSHLDTTVPSRSALDAVHERVLALGGRGAVRPHGRPRRAVARLCEPGRSRVLRLRGLTGRRAHATLVRRMEGDRDSTAAV